jgi:hypothetical protein
MNAQKRRRKVGLLRRGAAGQGAGAGGGCGRRAGSARRWLGWAGAPSSCSSWPWCAGPRLAALACPCSRCCCALKLRAPPQALSWCTGSTASTYTNTHAPAPSPPPPTAPLLLLLLQVQEHKREVERLLEQKRAMYEEQSAREAAAEAAGRAEESRQVGWPGHRSALKWRRLPGALVVAAWPLARERGWGVVGAWLRWRAR